MLDDHERAPIDDKLRATLTLLKKMTLDHAALSADDMRAVLATGVSKAALRDAIEVAYLFGIYDRLADAMGWDVPPEGSGSYVSGARRLLSRGYA